MEARLRDSLKPVLEKASLGWEWPVELLGEGSGFGGMLVA